jgi:hypothetical protein
MDDSDFFHMRLFRPGTVVRMGRDLETVSHVLIRRKGLWVHLVGHDAPVGADTLTLEPTVFTTVRSPH